MILVCLLDSVMEVIFFQHVSDAIRYIMCQYEHNVISYCDDLIGYGLPSKIDASFNTLCSLLQEVGLTINEAKLVPPSTSVTCLDILIITIDGIIYVSP